MLAEAVVSSLVKLREMLESSSGVTAVTPSNMGALLAFRYRGCWFLAEPSSSTWSIGGPPWQRASIYTNDRGVRSGVLGTVEISSDPMAVARVLEAFLPPPVTVTREGDALNVGTLLAHSPLDAVQVLEHAVCGGSVDVVTTTPTHRAFRCGRCGLRVTAPLSAKTVGELRAHFDEVLR